MNKLHHTFVALVVMLAAFWLGACSSKTSETTPTAETATSTGVATVAATATPAPTPLPTSTGGRTEVPSTVQLIDVRAGTLKTLYQSSSVAASDAEFEGDRITIRAGGGALDFRLDGMARPGQMGFDCRELTGAAEIAGRTYAGARCGAISPDRAWMTYGILAGEVTLPSGYVVPLGEQWLLELGTGTTRLVHSGLVHCGGCDARYGPILSPSSRYVAYAETGGSQRRFLTEAASGATRVIGNGSQTPDAPVWSLRGDRLLYRSGQQPVFEDLANGASRELDMVWPAAFDRSGSLVYAPAWAPSPKSTGLSTTIADSATGRVVAMMDGAPSPWRLYTGSSAVAATPSGVIAALQGAPNCNGTAIYFDGALRQCVTDGVEGQIGPDGLVAVARKTGAVGPAFGPHFQTISIDQFDIDLVTVGGTVQTVARGVLSLQTPLMVWDPAGTHLLVLWPRSAGL